MRVIAGSSKGRHLLSVPGSATRPITDRVKESLFNILSARVQGARVLDLFAGTGSVGIEALSRGAVEAVFVEFDMKALQVLKRNLELTGLTSRAKIVRQDVFRFLARPVEEPFDLIYVAPPQYRDLWTKTLEALEGTAWLAENGLVVVQIHPKEYRPLELHTLNLVDQRQYGSTMLCFYAKRESSSAER